MREGGGSGWDRGREVGIIWDVGSKRDDPDRSTKYSVSRMKEVGELYCTSYSVLKCLTPLTFLSTCLTIRLIQKININTYKYNLRLYFIR